MKIYKSKVKKYYFGSLIWLQPKTMFYKIFVPIILQVFLIIVATNGRPNGERSTREQQSISSLIFLLHYSRVKIQTFIFFSGYEEYEEQLRITSRHRGSSSRFLEVGSERYSHESTTEYWNAKGREILHKHLMRDQNKGVAKNVIFFLGDGMSIPTITAARIYLGQLNQERGEEAELSFEKFPDVGLSKVSRIFIF